MKTIRDELSAQTRKDYDEATTYHDGKWLLLTVDGDKVVDDVELVLTPKRSNLMCFRQGNYLCNRYLLHCTL